MDDNLELLPGEKEAKTNFHESVFFDENERYRIDFVLVYTVVSEEEGDHDKKKAQLREYYLQSLREHYGIETEQSELVSVCRGGGADKDLS